MNTSNKVKVFATTNIHLERFLYAHKIKFFHQRHLADRMNCWYYDIISRFLEVLNEFFEIYGGDVETIRAIANNAED